MTLEEDEIGALVTYFFLSCVVNKAIKGSKV